MTAARATRSQTNGVGIGLRLGAAAALGASAAIHFHLWDSGYRRIPTIGPLFLLQAMAAAALALAVLSVPRAWSGWAGLAGAGFLVSTVAGLVLSAQVGLFGFKDSYSAPWAKASLAVEIVGAVLGLALGGPILKAHLSRTGGNRRGPKEEQR